MPASTLANDLLSMLEHGRLTDLTLEAVYGDATPVRLACHANVLSQRSAVFRAALDSGMSESTSRTITVRDVPPAVLKALLVFLYTDSFEQVQKVLREEGAAFSSAVSSSALLSASSSAAASAAPPASSSASVSVPVSTPAPVPTPTSASTPAAGPATTAAASASSATVPSAAQSFEQLQAVLAAAHKYQVTRLLRWSEAQLCDLVRVETVCSLLALAHLYEGPELEEHCLHFINSNTAAVVERPEFATLPPRSLVKFNMWAAGVDPTDSRKRPRSAE